MSSNNLFKNSYYELFTYKSDIHKNNTNQPTNQQNFSLII